MLTPVRFYGSQEVLPYSLDGKCIERELTPRGEVSSRAHRPAKTGRQVSAEKTAVVCGRMNALKHTSI